MDCCKLFNGITVVTEDIDYLNSLTIGVFIKSGSSLETKDSNGITHLTEHVICHEFVNGANNNGIQCNGLTTKEYMCFFVKSVYTDMHLMVECLRCIFDPHFSVEEFSVIKSIVKREIVSFYNNDDNVMDEILIDTHTKHNPYSLPINGTCDNIDRFSMANVMGFFENSFVGEAIFISIAGKRASECKQILLDKNICFNIARGVFSSKQNELLISHNRESKLLTFHTKNTKVKMCINGLGRLDEEKYAFQVLCAILGGTSKSVMNSIFRNERGISYLAYCLPIFFQFGGLLFLNVDAEEKEMVYVLELMQQIFQLFETGSISSDDINFAKKHCINENILKHETSSSIMTRNGLNALFGINVTVPEEMRRINSVTDEDLARISKKIFYQNKTILIGTTSEHETLSEYGCSSYS